MTWPALIARTTSSLVVLVTPVTVTPLEPWQVGRRMSQQQSRSLERADQPRLADYSQGLEGCDTGDDRKTCLFETLAGLCVSLDSLAEASSAKEPLAILNASSATSKSVTSELISETRPATSNPGRRLWFRNSETHTHQSDEVGCSNH